MLAIQRLLMSTTTLERFALAEWNASCNDKDELEPIVRGRIKCISMTDIVLYGCKFDTECAVCAVGHIFYSKANLQSLMLWNCSLRALSPLTSLLHPSSNSLRSLELVDNHFTRKHSYSRTLFENRKALVAPLNNIETSHLENT